VEKEKEQQSELSWLLILRFFFSMNLHLVLIALKLFKLLNFWTDKQKKEKLS